MSIPSIVPLLGLAQQGGEPGLHPPAPADGAAALAWLIPLLPLLGSVLLLFAGKRLQHLAGWIATATVAAGFVLSVAIFVQLAGASEDARSHLVGLFTWIDIGSLELTTDLLVDPLSVTMLLVVTGVGALVHLYSIGYMRGDEREQRYFAYLNLFVFSMLVLVLASNFVVLFVGWELVGLCSYLLIGFWFEHRANAVAAKKAFIVNRVGDVAFSIGLFLIFARFGSLAFTDVLGNASEVLGSNAATATAIALLLFGGAAGKSAQIPLYVWLPDAMAGPTPVSALIHAATMVTAGVYMVARTSAIYVLAPAALEVVATVGVATAFLAALIALQQDDIKKVLAYSTVSQLGYMFVGLGTGAFAAGIFHLVTHAFFKGLLFLAAGSVMHAANNETDMWRLGGLRKAMPITFATSVVAVIAISGVPPFAGFFSKDQILASAYHHGFTGVWLVGLVTAGLTALYMGRWLFVTFFGRAREAAAHAHESPWVMTVPLVVLAVLSAAGGLLNYREEGALVHWLEPVLGHATFPAIEGGLGESTVIGLTLAVVAVGLLLAWALYLRRRDRDPISTRLGDIALLMRRRFLVDELYEHIFVRLGGAFARLLAWFDARVVDGIVNGVARGAIVVSSGMRVAQGGLARGSIAILVAGVIGVVAAFLVRAG